MRQIFTSLMLVVVILCSPCLADDGSITPSAIEKFEADFSSDGDHTAIMNAVVNNDIKKLALNRQRIIDHNTLVNYQLETSDVTNQRSSGRCWMFAAFNTFAPNVMTKLDISDFVFSHTYLTFWDKMEKANLTLEQIIAFRDLDVDDRKVMQVVSSPFGDGGWYNYFAALVEKYGVVPYAAMPETKQSSKTGTVNMLASRKLRVFASELHQMHADGKSLKQLRQRKAEMLSEIYRLMAFCYGEPPKEFEFRYEPKDDSIKAEIKTYTPKSFSEEFIGDFPEYVPIVCNPYWKYDVPYQGEFNRNIYEADDHLLLNLPIERLKYYTKKALLDSQLVWFANDVGKGHLSDSGIFSPDIYQYEELLGIDFSITKEQRLRYGDGSATHAMVLAGMDTTDAGTPTKWLVENSWGTKKGDDGHWYMYDEWFDQFVYVVMIDKKLLDPEDLEKYQKKPEKAKFWDVFLQSLNNLQ